MFVLRANVPSDRWWLRLKFQFLVARDHAFIFVIVQLVCQSIYHYSLHVCILSADSCYKGHRIGKARSSLVAYQLAPRYSPPFPAYPFPAIYLALCIIWNKGDSPTFNFMDL